MKQERRGYKGLRVALRRLALDVVTCCRKSINKLIVYLGKNKLAWFSGTRHCLKESTRRYLKESSFEQLLPVLEKAPMVNAMAKRGKLVDARASSASSYTILDVSKHLLPLHQLHKTHEAGCPDFELQKQTIDALLLDVLPHVRLADGSSPALEDCLVANVQFGEGAFSPKIHWDTAWEMWPGADGFQLWYLLEPHTVAGEGNMFMVSTPELDIDDTPIKLVPKPDGTVLKMLNDNKTTTVIHKYASLDSLGLQFEYLDMQPGECLVFSKRTLHVSDPRPHLKKQNVPRIAFIFRVVLRPRGSDTIQFNHRHKHCDTSPAYMELKRRVVVAGDSGKLAVGRYELMDG